MRSADTGHWMWDEACEMIARAERLHRQFFRPNPAGLPAASWEPPIDVFETDREVWIIVALPGVEGRDLDVAIELDTVVVTGLRRLPAVARGAVVHRLEIPRGRFERRIRLSAARLQLSGSELVDGCLVIRLAKQAETGAPR